VVPKSAQELIGVSMSRIIGWLYAPDGRFGGDPIGGRDAVLTKSFEEGLGELNKRFGSDMEKWRLGAYHHATIIHPISSALKPDERARFDVGDLPRGGDGYTIDATGGSDNQTAGGSLKMIVDTEDWDQSIAQNNPGQSGDVNDPHYRDLYELWARGRYFPLLFSRPRIESVMEKKIRLSAGGTGP
jgi:penicillin G amidase